MTVNDLLAIVKSVFLSDDGEARQQLADAFLDAGEEKTAEIVRYGSNPAGKCYSCGEFLHCDHPNNFMWETDNYGEYITEVVTCEMCKMEHILTYRLTGFAVKGVDEEEADNICLSEIELTYAPTTMFPSTL